MSGRSCLFALKVFPLAGAIFQRMSVGAPSGQPGAGFARGVGLGRRSCRDGAP